MPSTINTEKPVFNILIVGAGLGGLAAAIALKKKGHNVRVLEAANGLKEVGAGIQIPPNNTRILQSWGLKDALLQKVVLPKAMHMRRYKTGEVIGVTPLDPTMSEKYGYPYWLIHRADYQKALYDAALALGVEVTMDAWVDKVDRDEAKVTLANGTVITADLLIGADGIRSQVRKFAVMPNEIVEPHTTTNCAYRAIVPGHIMRADPKVAHLMDEPYSNCWIGYRRHIMAYPIRNGTLYNMVMSHPGQATVGLWNEPGNLEEMKAHYAGWDPIIDSILPKIEGCLKWKLADLPALSTWVSDTGKAVLIGDAAHAMVPYLAQGAAQAIEDAATIAECIDRARSTEDFSKVLAIYQSIRKPRCEKIQKGSMDSGDIWHIPDGPEQVARDADMKIVMDIFAAGETVAITKKSGKPNPNRWSDEEFQSWLFGHDAVTHANTQLDLLLNL